MRKILLFLVIGVVVVALCGTVFLYSFFSGDGLRHAIEEQATAWLGQPVKIGRARAALFPRTAIRLGDVRIGEPARVSLGNVDVSTDFRELISRRGIAELLDHPKLLEKIEPSVELVKTLMTHKDLLDPRARILARKIIDQVVQQLKKQLEIRVEQAITSALRKDRHSPRRVFRNLDLKRTLRKNLHNWDADRKLLLVDDVFYFSAERNKRPWHIIVCVDQSGSMLDSAIFSAVMASIFAELPAVKTSLVLFDTQVVDLSDKVGQPVDVLLSIQLGGGTDITQALLYSSSLVRQPQRTIVVLITLWLRRARLGHYLLAVRADEDAARASGIDVLKVKLQGMALSAFLTGIGGGLFAMYVRVLDPPSLFSLPDIGVKFALISLIGGIGTIIGPVIGAIMIVPLENYLRGTLGGDIPGGHLIILGAILVAASLFLSPRTIEFHLGHVYRTLGVSNRTELARVLLTGS